MKPAVAWHPAIDSNPQQGAASGASGSGGAGRNAGGRAVRELSRRSPELELMLACSRWPQSDLDVASIRRLSRLAIDWNHFAILTGHHRVAPLVLRNLITAQVQDMPAAIVRELEEGAQRNVYRCMAWLAEVQRLLTALEEKQIEVRVLKGLPLAQLAFGDIGLRACGDIDLLIEERHIAAADQILRSLGYDGAPYEGSPNQGFPTLDALSASRLSFYVSHWKDFTYFNHAVDFDLDLHWRCFRNCSQPGTSICAIQDKEWVPFGHLRIATLPLHENILYLCVHGALDGWLYLKSLADVAALLRPLSRADCQSLAAKARQYGVAAELAAVLVLVREYFGYEIGAYEIGGYELASQALPGEKDSSVAHILKYARYALSTHGALSSREDIPSLTTALFELGLHSGLRYWLEIAVRILFRPSMWTRFPLPDSLFGLYALLSPIDWLLHHRRRTNKPLRQQTFSS